MLMPIWFHCYHFEDIAVGMSYILGEKLLRLTSLSNYRAANVVKKWNSWYPLGVLVNQISFETKEVISLVVWNALELTQ